MSAIYVARSQAIPGSDGNVTFWLGGFGWDVIKVVGAHAVISMGACRKGLSFKLYMSSSGKENSHNVIKCRDAPS